MKVGSGVKGIIFSLIISLIKGFGTKAIGIVFKGLIMAVPTAALLTYSIFSWGEFSKIRFLISVVFFFAAIAGVVAFYVLHKAPVVIDPAVDETIEKNYDYIYNKVGTISEKTNPENLFYSSKEMLLEKCRFLSPFLSGVTYDVFSKYATIAAQLGSNFSDAVNVSYSYLSKLENSKNDPKAYLINFLSPVKLIYRIPINGLKDKVKLALILVPLLCLGIRIYKNFDLVMSWL